MLTKALITLVYSYTLQPHRLVDHVTLPQIVGVVIHMGTPVMFWKELSYAYKIFPKSEPIWLDIGLEIVKTA